MQAFAGLAGGSSALKGRIRVNSQLCLSAANTMARVSEDVGRGRNSVEKLI
jgi:hypothetical protein